MQTYLFAAIAPAADVPGDVLGLWQGDAAAGVNPPATARGTATAADSISVWRYDLPRHPARAAWLLSTRKRRLAAAERTLPGVQERLAVFHDGLARGGAAFALSAPSPAGPERELQAWLQVGVEVQAGGQAFGPLDALQEIWDGARRLADDVTRFTADVRGALAPRAVVATGLGPAAVGRTELSWLGSCATWLRNDLAPAQSQLHVQAVRQVLQTRRTWLRIGLLVVGGATGLASLLGANPFALLAVYRFVRRLVEEYRIVRQTVLVQPT